MGTKSGTLGEKDPQASHEGPVEGASMRATIKAPKSNAHVTATSEPLSRVSHTGFKRRMAVSSHEVVQPSSHCAVDKQMSVGHGTKKVRVEFSTKIHEREAKKAVHGTREDVNRQKRHVQRIHEGQRRTSREETEQGNKKQSGQREYRPRGDDNFSRHSGECREGTSHRREAAAHQMCASTKDHWGVGVSETRRGSRKHGNREAVSTITVACHDSGDTRISGKPKTSGHLSSGNGSLSRAEYLFELGQPSPIEVTLETNLPDMYEDEFDLDFVSGDEKEEARDDSCQSSVVNSTSSEVSDRHTHASCGADGSVPRRLPRVDETRTRGGRGASDIVHEFLPHRVSAISNIHSHWGRPQANDCLPRTSSGVDTNLPYWDLPRPGRDSQVQKVADRIKARHPPKRGPEVIPATKELLTKKWMPHGGRRERRAHAEAEHVQGIRRRGSASTYCDVPSNPVKQKHLSSLREKFSKRK